MKNKIIKIIPIMIIILIIVLIFFINNPIVKALANLNNIYISDEFDKDTEIPKYLNFVMGEYKGELTTQIVAKAYNSLAKNVIPKYYSKYSELNENEIEEVFNKNKNIIYIELGYDDVTQFKEFINTLKLLNGNNIKFESYRILRETILNSKQTLTTYFAIKYKENEEIYFKSVILNREDTKRIPIILLTDIDKNKLEKDKEIEEWQDELKKQKSPYTRGTPL